MFLLSKVFFEAKCASANLCQKLLFLHQLTHNMTTDCSLNYKLNTSKFKAQTWGEHVVYRNCFWHSEKMLYTTCSPHVLQKEELLTKIYLYRMYFIFFYFFFRLVLYWCQYCVIFGKLYQIFTKLSKRCHRIAGITTT